jgi:hypothetical protein
MKQTNKNAALNVRLPPVWFWKIPRHQPCSGTSQTWTSDWKSYPRHLTSLGWPFSSLSLLVGIAFIKWVPVVLDCAIDLLTNSIPIPAECSIHLLTLYLTLPLNLESTSPNSVQSKLNALSTHSFDIYAVQSHTKMALGKLCRIAVHVYWWYWYVKATHMSFAVLIDVLDGGGDVHAYHRLSTYHSVWHLNIFQNVSYTGLSMLYKRITMTPARGIVSSTDMGLKNDMHELMCRTFNNSKTFYLSSSSNKLSYEWAPSQYRI